jgi:hypothetical protein
MTKVFVVMGNDFPAAVFTTEQAAEDYCVDQREETEAKRKRGEGSGRIYWRVYPFDLQSTD